MPVDVSIFIVYDESVEALSKMLQETLNMQMREGDYSRLVNHEKNLWCYLERASFQLSGSNRVYDYRIACDLPEGGPAVTGRVKAKRAQSAFDTLKATGQYALLLVYNLEKVLDEYIPRKAGA